MRICHTVRPKSIIVQSLRVAWKGLSAIQRRADAQMKAVSRGGEHALVSSLPASNVQSIVRLAERALKAPSGRHIIRSTHNALYVEVVSYRDAVWYRVALN